MKNKEWITLGAGVVIIGALVWFGGFFPSAKSGLNISSEKSIMNTQKGGVPPIEGKNISQDPKLQIIDVAVGTGTEAKKGSKVSVHYTGRLADGTVFDSSYSRGEPIEFVLSTGQVIRGWDVGLMGMKVGGKRRLVIDSEYAYGSAGVQGVIPPNATLIFDVELANVK